MKSLLERARTINRQVQKFSGSPANFDEIARVLSEMIEANCYIVGRQGQILGYALIGDFTCDAIEGIVYGQSRFPENYHRELLRASETRANMDHGMDACVLNPDRRCVFGNKLVTVVPITGGGQRLATLMLVKFEAKLTDDDLVLAEYGATLVGLEILRSMTEKIEEEARKKAAVHIAIGTLSYSELEAVEHIFDELKGSEGVLVASKIADRVGITRSVVVNALRKFESAGVVETRSLGMKGTYIRILNEFLLESLEKLR